MRVLRALFLAVLFGAVMMHAQEESASASTDDNSPRPVPPVIASMQQPVKVRPSHVVADGTAVSLRLVTEIKSKLAQPGDVADFVLDHDLWNRDLLVARKGTSAEAVVVEASKAKWASRGSKLAIEIKALRMLNGQLLPLRGTPFYRGGVGPVAHVGAGLMNEAAAGPNYCPICEIVFLPVTVVSLAVPGTNKDVKANTIATAWVDGDVSLDAESFRAFQPASGSQTAKVRIVRGVYGSASSRDLYCNGVPLAHLSSKRRLEIELSPGWYRFAINPKREPLELYLEAGREANLITDSDLVYVINEPGKAGKKKSVFAPDRSVNTASLSPFGKHKSEMEYLQSAKPTDAADRYPTECRPLAEEIIEGPK